MRKASLTAVLLCGCFASGCALFGKSDPLDVRYYSPERLGPPRDRTAPSTPEVELRLGSVVAASHLRERIAYRPGERELGFYLVRRWTEQPDTYLRRALSDALFDERGLLRVTSGVAPTLEVELTHFEELLSPRHAVRVEARVMLVDQRVARFEHTVRAEQEVSGDEFAAVADAFAMALGRCVDEISDRVVAELRARLDPPAAPPPG